jgi:hypothetical protein
MKFVPLSPALIVPLGVMVALLALIILFAKVPLSYNLRNLIVRWPTTLLTALAFTMVISLLTVMLAFANGMSKLTDESGHKENVVVLADGSTDESFSTLGFSDSSDIDHEPGIMVGSTGKPLCSREVYLIAIQTLPPKPGATIASQTSGKIKKVMAAENRITMIDDKDNVLQFKVADKAKIVSDGVAGNLEYAKPGDLVWLAYEQKGEERVATDVHISSRRRFIQVRGVEDPLIAAEVHRLELLPGGTWFSESGVEQLSPSAPGKEPETAVQAVLGEGTAKAMGPDMGKKDGLEVGDVFELGPKKWKVVGILKAAGTIFGSEVWAKRSYVGELYGKPSTISSITIRTQSAEAAEKLAADLKNFKKAKLNPQTEIDYYSQQRTFLLIIRTAIIVLVVFMAFGGIFGVMNTMFAAISQRTKDIGVLRIVGYARWQVLVSFLLESLLIALVGGLVGCALGMLSNGLSATSVVGGGQGFGKTVVLRLAVTPDTIAIGVFLTLIMGLLGGLLPALAAMRLRPLESLR